MRQAGPDAACVPVDGRPRLRGGVPRRGATLVVGLALVLLSGCQACERLESPAAFRCARDAGTTQCLAGWRCGLDGFCFDPAVERVAPCEGDEDCALSFRCGPPLATAFTPALQCRARGVGAAYACSGDGDCEGGWRCGLAGACLDTAHEALRPAPTPDALTVSHLSPRLDATGLVDVAVSDRFEVDSNCPAVATTREVVSVVSAGGVVQRLLVPGDVPAGAALDCDAGPPGALAARRSPAALERVEVDAGPVVALAQSDATTFVLHEGGRVCRVDAAARVACEGLGLDARGLRIGRHGLVVAFGAAAFRVLDVRDGGWSPPLTVEDTNGDAAALHEVTALWPWRAAGGALVAATASGFFQVPIDTSGRLLDGGWPQASDWVPATSGGLDCGGAATEVPLGLGYDEVRDQLLVRVRSRTSGVEGARVMAWQEGLASGCAPLGATGPGPGGGYAPTLLSHACGDATPRLVSAVAGQPELPQLVSYGAAAQTLEVRCEGEDGGVELAQRAASGAVAIGNPAALRAEPFHHAAVKRARANPHRAAAVGPTGAVWLEHGASRVPLLLDRVPLGRSTLPDGSAPAFVAPTRDVAGTALPGLALLAGGAFVPTPEVGLVLSAREELRWEAIAPERPEYSLVSAPLQPSVTQQVVLVRGAGPSQPVALTTALDRFSPPFRLAPQVAPDGGTVVLASAFDALLAADVTRALATPFDAQRDSLASLPTLVVRAVPLPRTPITSLLALPPEADAQGRRRLAEGYLLGAGRLFRFEGESEVVWRTRELEVPFGEPLELFAQAGRARLGFRSGQVYSLPSRVPLAPAVPGGAAVLDFLSHCDAVLALTGEALFRLEVAGTEVQGRWVPVPLAAHPGPGAALFRHGAEVLLVTADGATTAVAGWSCP